jgi:hypothetical protein
MARSARLLGPNGALLGAMMAAVVVLPGRAWSQSDQVQSPSEQMQSPSGQVQGPEPQSQGEPDESASRGVRIIDAPTLSPGAGNAPPLLKSPDLEIPSPAALTPAAPALTPAAPAAATVVPSLTPPAATVRPAPSLTPVIGGIPPAAPVLSPAPELRPIPAAPTLVPPAASRPNSNANLGPPVPTAPVLIAPSSAPSMPYGAPSGPPPALDTLADLPKQPEAGVQRTQAEIAALSSGLKIPNAAGLNMQILPGPDIAVGSQVSFQISSKKAGYLILVDVEATGKLVQIYPNPMSLMTPGGVREKANYLRPGKPLRIPDRDNLYAGFEFVASPPSGTAMVIAILGDRPVQMVDLPDVPLSLAGSASAVEYLTKLANGLRIPDATGSGRLEDAHWSFDAKFYAIR